ASWTTPANNVALDMIYLTFTGGTVTLTCYDSGNNTVALSTTTESLTNPPRETTISAASLNSNITHFSVRASGLSTGYDNITLSIPEPAGAAQWAIPLAAL